MPRKFKVEILGVDKEVIRLGRQGKNSNYIANWLWEVKRISITHSSIQSYLSKHGIDNRVSNIPLGKSSLKEVEAANESKGEEIHIDIEAYKKLWNIPEKLDSPEKIIALVQRASAEIHVLNMMVVHAYLTAHIENKDRYPKQKINGLKVTYEVMAQSWGLTQTIDVNSAMQTLEKHGNLEAIRLMEESD